LVMAEPRVWPLLLVVVSVPVALALIRLAYGATGTADLNRLLRKTAGLHLRFGGLLTLGLITRAIIDRV
jgi:hypothetical protein